MPKSVEASLTFSVPPRVLYQVFLDSQDLSRVSLSPSTINPIVGGSFTMFNGGVTGTITHLEPNQRIVEDWRFSQWEDGAVSHLELLFEAIGYQKTKLIVKQSNIPDVDKHGNGEQDRLVLNGWKDKLFMSLEKVFGFTVERE
jgi:activator of HSP90 ATPase